MTEVKEIRKSTYSGVREQREDTVTVTDWGGSAGEAAELFGQGCMNRGDRSFMQGLQCQQINSVMALLSMDDSAFVVHSPLGCSGCCSMANDWFRVGQLHRGNFQLHNARIIVTNLDEKDVVLGGVDKLEKAIRLANERHNPKIIFIFTSCASGIIGDDIDSVARELQPETDAIIVPIHCEGFKSKVCASGYDASFIAFTKYLLEGQPKQEKVEGLLNLFAPPTVSYMDQIEIERILSEIGLEVNYIPFYSSLEKIRRIPQAQASTAICKVFADEFMKELEDTYDIPYAHTIMPIGTRNTDRWLRGVAKIMGKEAEAEAYIAKEKEQIAPLVADLRRRLEGKTVFICGGTGRSFAAAALIDDFGMKLVGMETPVYDENTQEDTEKLTQLYGDYTLGVGNMMPFEQVNLLHKLQPDVFIGIPIWAARMGFPTSHVLDIKRPTLGYRNLVYLGNKIASQIENPGLNKQISKYASLPYKQSWYETDTFRFVDRHAE
ncbi:MAG: nitrogen fixation protein NifE [Clostridiales Family XIII bacterium]|jgi:nitrogenase molybdenum-iron protein alpha chain|nr:nitrogen fixation protein NifE [Clostridiales Family XIII bacterium]